MTWGFITCLVAIQAVCSFSMFGAIQHFYPVVHLDWWDPWVPVLGSFLVGVTLRWWLLRSGR